LYMAVLWMEVTLTRTRRERTRAAQANGLKPGPDE
jgi:hypothetical protein